MKRLFALIATLLIAGTITAALAAVPKSTRYWVYLRDKGAAELDLTRAIHHAQSSLTERSKARRARNHAALADYRDLPVCQSYVCQVTSTGASMRVVSRWLNAVSVECSPEVASELRRLRFVQRVDAFRLVGDVPRLQPARNSTGTLDDPVYGPSLRQNELCRVPELHARGLTGEGVLICMLDTGYWLEHESMSNVNIIAQRDFIHQDTTVRDQPGQDSTGQHGHGTAVLSTIAGYKDSVLIGPAYGAQYLLAKTEWISGEERFEEDTYVAALEWADSIGADITSSSLGYIDWYTYGDLDGHTAVTTQAVVIAARRGVLCVTSAGNNRLGEWYFIGTPADADSILAIGAVDSAGVLADFSSGGPTADGRTKPDVSAMGRGVFCASYLNDNHYWLLSGTSLSAPIAAGIAALIMEAHPDWTAQDVRRAMMSTASRADAPDNEIGWGVIDGVEAVDFDLATKPVHAPMPATLSLASFPNPVNGTARLEFYLPNSGGTQVRLFDITGREVANLAEAHFAAGAHVVPFLVDKYPSGIYFAKLSMNKREAIAKILILK